MVAPFTIMVTAHALRKIGQTSPQPKQVTGEVLTLREKLSGITERWDVMASYLKTNTPAVQIRHKKGGAYQTVQYAEKHSVEVVNLTE